MSDLLEATCPNCSTTKKIRREWLGRKIQCPCGTEFDLAYPAVKKVEVDKSSAVEPRKASKARKKSDVPVVRTFEIKKTRLGAYKAWYKCPHCNTQLHSDESELQGRDRCLECNRPFRVSKDAIAEIDSRRERAQAEKQRKKLDKNMILIVAPPKNDAELIEPPNVLAVAPVRANRPTPPVQITVEHSRASHSLGISSLVLGILSFFVCWIPFIGFAIGGLGIVLGGTGLVLAIFRNGSGIGYSIAGTALSSFAVLFGIGFLYTMGATLEGIDQAMQPFDDQAIQQIDNELEDNEPQAVIPNNEPQAKPVPDEAVPQGNQPVKSDAERQEEKRLAAEVARKAEERRRAEATRQEEERKRRMTPLVVENWNWKKEFGFVIVEGEVTNRSNQRLKNVEVVVSYYTEDDKFITSSNAIVEYNPILPGQTTPFKAYATYNPRMKSARLAFKHLLGGTIGYTKR